MFLTLYYMAATWLQAWRLNFLRSKIKEILLHDAALVLYQEPNISAVSDGSSTHAWNQHLCGLSSPLCENEQDARVADLMWYHGSKRGCSVFPQQVVNLSSWIAFSEGGSPFPMTPGKVEAESLQTDRLCLLIEAQCQEDIDVDKVHYCELKQFGSLQAWTYSGSFGVILETDLEHLVMLCGCFMVNRLAIHQYLEMSRIQTVVVQGEPCQVFNVPGPVEDRTPENPKSVIFPSYLEQLNSFCHAAQQAVLSREQVSVEGEVSTMLLPAGCETLLETSDPETELDTFPEEACQLQMEVSLKAMSRLEDPSLQTLSVGGRSSDSFCSLDSLNTTISCLPISPRRSPAHSAVSNFSAAYSTLSLSSISSTSVSKPPNVLIYSDSSVAQDNVISVLRNTLHRHKYTIYGISRQSLLTNPWMQSTRLLVICGSVPDPLAPLFLSYIFHGGRMLCLCSDFLHLVLPTFRTAEVRQHELVRFSYAGWKNVPMMHHVFCYQASPVRTRFANSDPKASSKSDFRGAKPPATPTSVEVVDAENRRHILQVEVLGAEETWHTPSLLLATTGSGSEAGKIVFSQVHLEVDPSQYESEEGKYSTLRQSDSARREILRDLLTRYLDMESGDCSKGGAIHNTQGYFLGRHELKQDMLFSLKMRMKGNNILCVGSIELQFCGKGERPPTASDRLFPILMHSCPPSFSTVEYFDNLKTEWLGRLVIYAEVMASSQQVLGLDPLWNGLVVIPRQQTGGQGRSSNQWISPEGCAMSSIQFILPVSSILGQRPSLLQHIIAIAVVSVIADTPDVSKAVDLRLKWPNDIYCVTDSGLSKIGGLIVSCTTRGKTLVCTAGIGVNLDNRDPTTCINEQIMLHNVRSGSKVQPLSLERYLALFFTELERLVTLMQCGQEKTVMDLYYKFWLHSDAEIVVRDTSGKEKAVTVRGIDEFGFLLVSEKNNETFSVQPDGNTFDMCIGLIAPK